MALPKILSSREMRIGYGVALLIVVVAVSAKLFVGQAHADIPIFNQDERHIAIKGYDTVAYFLENTAIEGRDDFNYRWQDANWHFANANHRDLFAANPGKYAPRFGGYCAMGIALGKVVDVDPQAWTIVDGQLYLNKSTAVRDAVWRKDKQKHIAQANANWEKNRAELSDER